MKRILLTLWISIVITLIIYEYDNSKIKLPDHLNKKHKVKPISNEELILILDYDK